MKSGDRPSADQQLTYDLRRGGGVCLAIAVYQGWKHTIGDRACHPSSDSPASVASGWMRSEVRQMPSWSLSFSIPDVTGSPLRVHDLQSRFPFSASPPLEHKSSHSSVDDSVVAYLLKPLRRPRHLSLHARCPVAPALVMHAP